MNSAQKPVIVGTRGSTLAMWQTNAIIDMLQQLHPDEQFEIKVIKTAGDKTQAAQIPLSNLTENKGLFVAELEGALLDKSEPVDMAIHSLKDLESTQPPELMIAAVTSREDPRDVLISRSGYTLSTLPKGARVGTSSMRRAAQLHNFRPDLQIETLRGNVDTRIKKALVKDGPDAIVLAAAGVKRLGFEEVISEYISTDIMLPMVGQGALAIETLKENNRARDIAGAIDEHLVHAATEAERVVLRILGGGCQVPLGAYAIPENNGSVLYLRALVASPDGERLLRAEARGSVDRPEETGREVAEDLLRQGAQKIMQDLKV